jgi:hypothetical protein
MAVTKSQKIHFENEMNHNPELYVDRRCNQVNLTGLAENFIDEHSSKDQEQVYEATIDWYDSWRGKVRYNNN